MLLAAMLAMVLAAAAPALAQQIGGDQGPVAGDDAVQAGDNVQYSAVCQNIIGSFEANAGQGADSDAVAVGGENAAAVSEVAQEQNVSVEQVNECLNAFFAASPKATAHAKKTASPAAVVQYKTASPAAVVQYKTATATATPTAKTVTATPTATATATATAAATATALPPTGGPMPSAALALGAAGLLIGGGLLARRIIR
jgi:hypothetical protein